jgi:hypothetical protein
MLGAPVCYLLRYYIDVRDPCPAPFPHYIAYTMGTDQLSTYDDVRQIWGVVCSQVRPPWRSLGWLTPMHTRTPPKNAKA